MTGKEIDAEIVRRVFSTVRVTTGKPVAPPTTEDFKRVRQLLDKAIEELTHQPLSRLRGDCA